MAPPTTLFLLLYTLNLLIVSYMNRILNLKLANTHISAKPCLEEYEALLKNHTWALVPATPAMNIVGCRWVFKVKHHANIITT